MQRFQSDVQLSKHPGDVIYQRICSFDHLGDMMPEQIIGWKSDTDRCSFMIKDMAEIEMSYLSRSPESGVHIVSEKSPFKFEIIIDIDDTPNGTKCRTTILAQLNSMLSMLASRPLKHLVESINNKVVS